MRGQKNFYFKLKQIWHNARFVNSLALALLIGLLFLKPAQAVIHAEKFNIFAYLYRIELKDESIEMKAQKVFTFSTSTVYGKFHGAKQNIRVLLIFIIFLIMGLFMLFVYIIYNRIRNTAKWRREDKTRNHYQSELANYLYDENPHFRFKGMYNESNRAIFLDELLRLHNTLLGDSQKKIQEVYYNLNLLHDSKNKLTSIAWADKAKGFREVSSMKVKDSAPLIEKHIHSKNNILRMEAHLALVKLNPDNPLAFLKNFNYPLTEWEQINILNALEAQNTVILSFEEWMDHKNDTIRIFALKLCGHYNHIHSLHKVIELLQHKNPDVTIQAVKTLASMNSLDNKEPLKKFFNKMTSFQKINHDLFFSQKLSNNKLEALKALSSLTTWEDAWFYKEVLSNSEEDFYVLKSAFEQLHRLVSNADKMLEELYSPAFPQIVKLMDQYRPR